MNEYILRLFRVGIAPHEAYRIYYGFLKEYGRQELERFVCDLEKEAYVDRVQQ